MTGESQPIEKGVGDRVFGATVPLGGKIHVRVEKTGRATVAAWIGEILNRTTAETMAKPIRRTYREKPLTVCH